MDPQNPQNMPQGPMVVQPTAQPQQPAPAGQPVDMMFQPSAPQGPSGNLPTQQPAVAGQLPPAPQPQVSPSLSPSPKRSKKPLIIIGIIVLVFAAASVAVVLMSSKKSKKPQETQTTNQQQGPQPAQAIDVEQTSNSISQDISGHDNNKDFPADQLTDDKLGL